MNTDLTMLRAALADAYEDLSHRSEVHGDLNRALRVAYTYGEDVPLWGRVERVMCYCAYDNARLVFEDIATEIADLLPHMRALQAHGACYEGLMFAAQYDTLQEAWDACADVAHLEWVLEAFDPDALEDAPWDDEVDAFRAAYACPDLPADAE